jgi:predicted 3-demethylubiquinone-9 3-methyltransferase (glyoxalase superfamily)
MDQLKNKWFPYMFYFVFQREPSSADKEYWYSRINSGDRNSIDKLGETMQWLKDKFGVSHK